MKKFILFILVLGALHYVFTYVVDFSTPAEKLAKRIKKMNIASFELQWDTGRGKEQNLIVVYEGINKNVAQAIQGAMDEIILHSQSDLSYIFVPALGILTLRGNDGSEERIDITHCSFFAGKQRVANAAFYCPALAGVVKDIYDHVPNRERLIMTEKLFETLAKGGNIKYAIKPEAREEFIKRISHVIQGK